MFAQVLWARPVKLTFPILANWTFFKLTDYNTAQHERKHFLFLLIFKNGPWNSSVRKPGGKLIFKICKSLAFIGEGSYFKTYKKNSKTISKLNKNLSLKSAKDGLVSNSSSEGDSIILRLSTILKEICTSRDQVVSFL